jgi:hypothetical protein
MWEGKRVGEGLLDDDRKTREFVSNVRTRATLEAGEPPAGGGGGGRRRLRTVVTPCCYDDSTRKRAKIDEEKAEKAGTGEKVVTTTTSSSAAPAKPRGSREEQKGNPKVKTRVSIFFPDMNQWYKAYVRDAVESKVWMDYDDGDQLLQDLSTSRWSYLDEEQADLKGAKNRKKYEAKDILSKGEVSERSERGERAGRAERSAASERAERAWGASEGSVGSERRERGERSEVLRTKRAA